MVGLRIAFGFLELVVISAVLQLGLALPMAYYFHRATSVAMPANLLVVPFLQLLMPAAVLAIGISYVSLALAKIPAAIAGVALEGIAGTVKWLGGLRLADIRVARLHRDHLYGTGNHDFGGADAQAGMALDCWPGGACR